MAANYCDEGNIMQEETAGVLEEEIIEAIANISISVRNVEALSETSKTPVCNTESAASKFKDDHLPKTKGIDILKYLLFSLNSATLEEADSEMSSIKSYLKGRTVGFPDKNYFIGLNGYVGMWDVMGLQIFPQVEIENFIFQYKLNNNGAIKNICDKLRISLLKRDHIYFGNLLNDAKEEDEAALLRLREYGRTWLVLGKSRGQLDFFINAFLQRIVVNSGFNIKITHNRLFDEGIKGSDDEMMSQNLELPISQPVPVESAPSSRLHGPASSLPSSSRKRQPVLISHECLFTPFRALYLRRRMNSIPPPSENDEEAMDED